MWYEEIEEENTREEVICSKEAAAAAYVIGKVLEETLRVARNASSYDKASSNSVINNSPIKSLLLSNEIMHMITMICSNTPAMRCPVSFLSKL